MNRARKTIRERIESKVDKDEGSGCWNWTAATNIHGYAVMGQRLPNGKWRMTTASRISYEEFVGPIPAGIYVCHHCDNPLCVNPEHLFLGTQLDNLNDMDSKGRGRQWGWGLGRANPPLCRPVAEAVAAANDQRSVSAVARDYGVSRDTIKRWRAKFGGSTTDPLNVDASAR